MAPRADSVRREALEKKAPPMLVVDQFAQHERFYALTTGVDLPSGSRRFNAMCIDDRKVINVFTAATAHDASAQAMAFLNANEKAPA